MAQGGNSNVGVDRRGLRQLALMPKMLRQTLPKYTFKALAAGLWEEGKIFKKQFRQNLNKRMKVRNSKVGNLFKVYTVGDRLADLQLGIFTIWPAAQTFQFGGTIRAKAGKWLVIAVTPKAYTAGGRIRKAWRDPRTGKFKESKFKDLVPIKVKGGFLLVKEQGINQKTKRPTSRVSKKRGVEAMEPIFMLIKKTTRKATLRFFEDFASFVGPRGSRLQQSINQALDAFAKLDRVDS